MKEENKVEKKEAVNHPSHYNTGKFEVIAVLEDWCLGFCSGNALKYIGRAGHKIVEKTIEDLNKAIWYCNRRIEEIRKNLCCVKIPYMPKITPEKVVKDWKLDLYLGNAITSLFYAEAMEPTQAILELQKAIDNVEIEITLLTKKGE